MHPRQEHVEEHDVRWMVGEQARSLGTVRRHLHLEPFAAETRGQALAVGLLVLDYQHPDALTDGDHEASTSVPGPTKAR
ncbi:MAG TPA: hypothetical protein VFC03_09975 [Acidimicrobiales bacterium]|nr:hypothetical protein [Acidimicrobiales bacterium]